MNSPYAMFGVECGTGWAKLYEPLIHECWQRGVIITQIKEKFGGLRFYVDAAPHDLHEKIDTAEAESFHICESCGNPGQTTDTGWLKTRCETCA